MTQVVVTREGASQKEIQLKLFNSLEGACNKDGTFKRGWEPTVQSYVRKEGVGNYVVVHNLNREDYSLSVGLLSQPGSFEIAEQGPVSFRLKTSLNKEPTDFDFRFAICIIGD